MADDSIQSNSYYKRIHAWVWTGEPRAPLRRHALHLARYALALARDMADGEISLRAMSLVYTTLLSLVPLLALAFSVLKALGVHNTLAPMLKRWLAPLGSQADVVAGNVIGFVDNMRVGVLGFVGVVLLLYTAVSMISKVESSFNFIWKVGRTRGLTQRFSEYLLVLMVGPLLLFAVLGLTASVRSSELVQALAGIQPFGALIVVLTKAAPYLMIIAALTFLYGYIPNTRVHWRAAAIGGLFAGVVWESASVAFATFVANANYRAIYAGFAVVIILLVWTYLGWLIVLFGCRLAFYVQHPRFLAGTDEPPPPSSREAEYLALRVAALVAGRFVQGQPGPSPEDLPRLLAATPERIGLALQLLTAAGLLALTQPGNHLLPARDPDSYTLEQLWWWCRGQMPEAVDGEAQERRVLALLGTLEHRSGAGAGQTLRQWLAGPGAGGA
ncbi:MAG: YihY/virulence factor BrkB family protein [Nevskia sp.]|nr:YihY/virulence factor BrkB family protein [Nevskia sp.]